MAQLKRSLNDGHLYILSGQSQGTWQITADGERWLREKQFPIPTINESIALSRETFRQLKAKGYLYTHGIEYKRDDPPEQIQSMRESLAGSLVMLLQVDEQRQCWTLHLDLAPLHEAAWAELQHAPDGFVTVTGAPSSALPLRQLWHSSLLQVKPQVQPYLLYVRHDQQTDHACQLADPTPGLTAGWRGNIFIEDMRQSGFWRRCLPNSVIPFSGAIYWLAQTGHRPDGWPGDAQPVGPAQSGWQLWFLVVEDNDPILWEALCNWFHRRALDLTAPRPHLEVVSPLSALTDDGWHVLSPTMPLIVRCELSRRAGVGALHRISLTLEALDKQRQHNVSPSSTPLIDVSARQAVYFRCPSLPPGSYRLRLTDDANAEPLLLRVASGSDTRFSWPPALCCTAVLGDMQQTFKAFAEQPDIAQHEQTLTMFASDALSALTWRLEPDGLPVQITWEYCSPEGTRQAGSRNRPVTSGEELTQCWQERIWPAIAQATQAKLTLNAGAFGYIELQLTPSLPQSIAEAPAINAHLRTQLTWLSHVAAGSRASNTTGHTVLPASLRAALQQLRTLAGADAVLNGAVQRLVARENIPRWILTRLQILFQSKV